MNYYRRYIGDYMRDTASLSITEHGAYTLLLDYAYATEKPIPGDRDEVMRLLRAFTSEERKAVDKVLARFWVLGEDGYRNQRVDEELAKAVKLIEKQKANGALGGRPKKTQEETQTETHGLTQTGTQNNQPPTSNLQPPTASLQPPTPKKEQKDKVAPMALPDWVPADAWAAWLEVRPKVKAPNTPAALKIALRELDSLRGQGQDPRAVLEQATTKGYRGLFPVGKWQQSLEDRNRAAVAGWKPPEALQ